MIINATIGDGAPEGFQDAVDAAIDYFGTTFTNNVTLNITFDWPPLGCGTVLHQRRLRVNEPGRRKPLCTI